MRTEWQSWLLKPYGLFLILVMYSLTVSAQKRSLIDSLYYCAELQGTAAGGEYNPLWLNANKYGLSSLKKTNGYVRVSLERPLSVDKKRKWGIGYGVDLAFAGGFTSRFVLHQAYVEGRWLKGVLTVGAKTFPMELKNMRLSSGSQALGINARPVPQVRLALPDYWHIPGLRGWLALKGHIAFGKPTDDKWQEDFTQKVGKYTNNALLHTKAGYLKIGPKNITVELGLEMASQFGGETHRNYQGKWQMVPNNSGIGAFWKAFIPGGSDKGETVYQNAEGNILGAWVMRFNIDQKTWNLGLYADKYFEDHSSMFMLDYDGYEPGKLYVRKDNRYVLYDFKDWMLGAELQLKTVDWLNRIVVEYLHTKYQSGPIYHDHTVNIADHLGGTDSYYNHGIFTGWQHWGQVMGNPLYRSPLYNDNGQISVENNRFVAWHLGLSGEPISTLAYRLLATYQTGYGTYASPYLSRRYNLSLLAELSYQFPKGWSITGAFGMDKGRLLGENYGVQLTIAKRGIWAR